MNIDITIFKAYDIRGVYPSQLDEDGAYAIARSYAVILKRENPGRALTIAVGGDMRLSTPSLKQRVIQGLLDSGLNVEDVGLVSTPTFYFAVSYFAHDGGIQVSASHNPGEYNGLKMVRTNGVPISKDTGIMEMRDMVANDNLGEVVEKKGQLSHRADVTAVEVADQIKHADISKIKTFKIVADAANAMGAVDIAELFNEIPGDLIKMNFELDGNFPSHEADPMKDENTADLRARVLAEGADLGLAPDGDNDRLFIIDEKGHTVPPAILRGLLAQIELRAHPDALVAYDIRPGRITRDMIEECHGKSIVTPVGHSLIKEAMLKQGAIFGGESSGHFFYKLPYGTFEAPMVLIVKLLQYLSESGKRLSEIVEPYNRYAHSGEINTKVASRDAVLAKIDELAKRYADGTHVLIDGLTVEYPDYWFNVRASNTEPMIRLTVEAQSPELMQEKRDELLALIRN